MAVDEALEPAGDDPALSRITRKHLETLATGAGGTAWRELARDVLAGRADMREALDSAATRDTVRHGMSGFLRWREEIGPEEFSRYAGDARQAARKLRERIEAERDPQDGR